MNRETKKRHQTNRAVDMKSPPIWCCCEAYGERRGECVCVGWGGWGGVKGKWRTYRW